MSGDKESDTDSKSGDAENGEEEEDDDDDDDEVEEESVVKEEDLYKEYYENKKEKFVGHVNKKGKCGFGRMYYDDGSFAYIGMWENDKRNGIGISYWKGKNMIEYAGMYLNGSRNGFGNSYTNTGIAEYSGFWKDDKPYKIESRPGEGSNKSRIAKTRREIMAKHTQKMVSDDDDDDADEDEDNDDD